MPPNSSKDNSKQQTTGGGLESQERGQETKRRLDRMDIIMAGVIIVLFIGFASMYVAFSALNDDSNGQKQATYQSLINQIQNQNTQIQVLTNQLRNSTVTPK